MKKQYQIKNPCKKYQLEVKADGQNFNCQVCRKNVKDLSILEDRQLEEQIQNNVNTCVKILPSQLNQLIANSKKAILYSSAIAILSTSCSNSLIQNFGYDYGKVVLDKKSGKTEEIPINEIRGKLLDAYDGNPLISVSIRIVGHDFKTNSDIDGNFRLQIPENIGELSKVRFDYTGYYGLEIEINKIKGKQIIVDLGPGPAIGYLELIK